jgi:hypothetical protein
LIPNVALFRSPKIIATIGIFAFYVDLLGLGFQADISRLFRVLASIDDLALEGFYGLHEVFDAFWGIRLVGAYGESQDFLHTRSMQYNAIGPIAQNINSDSMKCSMKSWP